MDFNTTIDLIIKDLDDARNIIDDLKKYPGVPILQVELAKSKCKSAGEIIALLKSFKDDDAGPEIIPAPPSKKSDGPFTKSAKAEDIPPLIKPIEAENITKDAASEFSNDEEFQIIETTEKKDNTEIIIPGGITEPATIILPTDIAPEGSKKTEKKEASNPIFADRFSHLSNRYNEQLGSIKGEDDGSEGTKGKSVSNLNDAIGINDRFLFIREIFNGDKDEYNATISKLEGAATFNDARTIIDDIAKGNAENEAINQLANLVKRKFPAHE